MFFKNLIPVLALMIPVAISQAPSCGGDDDDGDPRTEDTANGTWFVTYVPSPDPIPVKEVFALDISVYDETHTTLDAATSIAVDATMPSMGHGMDTTPVISPNGDGTFHVDNMEFSMEGTWEITVDVSRDGMTDRATFEVACCD